MVEISDDVRTLARAIVDELAPLVIAELLRPVTAERRMGPPRNLVGEIEALLRARGPSTAPEIARGIRTRDGVVRDLLRDDGRFVRVSEASRRSPKARLWSLAADPASPGPDGRTSEDEER